MSGDSEPMAVYSCRWAWCRLNFSDNDVLGRHVVLEHVRRAIPVRRKDVPMLRRAEEGLGESFKLSDIMRNPSSSLSQKSEISRDLVSSQPQLPSSLLLPSPSTLSQELPSQDQNVPEAEADLHSSFASLSSPTGSSASLTIPVSPAFSSLVHRTNSQKEKHLSNHFNQEFFSQESSSAVSAGSQRSVEEQLTQSFNRDDGDDRDNRHHDTTVDAPDEDDSSDSRADHLREDVPPSSGMQFESSQQHAHRGESNWESYLLSQTTAPRSDSQAKSTNPFLEAMSQPPSQLQLLTPFDHGHGTKSSPSQSQATDTASGVLSLPLNPVALSSPVGFTFSTPQRQAWYHPAPRRRISSGETHKPFSRRELSSVLPTVGEEKSRSQPTASRSQVQVRTRSPLTKMSGFRSGTLQVTCPSTSPHLSLTRFSPRPESIALPGINEEFDQQSPMSLDISYPPLQTQAPYQSQSLE